MTNANKILVGVAFAASAYIAYKLYAGKAKESGARYLSVVEKIQVKCISSPCPEMTLTRYYEVVGGLKRELLSTPDGIKFTAVTKAEIDAIPFNVKPAPFSKTKIYL